MKKTVYIIALVSSMSAVAAADYMMKSSGYVKADYTASTSRINELLQKQQIGRITSAEQAELSRLKVQQSAHVRY